MKNRKQSHKIRLWLGLAILCLALLSFCAGCGSQEADREPDREEPNGQQDAQTLPAEAEQDAENPAETDAGEDTPAATEPEADKPQALPEDTVGNSPEWPELSQEEQVVADYLSWLGVSTAEKEGVKDIRVKDEASGLTLRLPGYWQGLYLLKTSADLTNGTCFQLCDLYTHTRIQAQLELEEDTSAGWLLTIRAVPKEQVQDTEGHTLANGALSGWIGAAEQIIATDAQYAYCLSEPTDVQFDPEDGLSSGIYKMMQESLQSIVVYFLKDNQLTPNTKLPGLSCYQYQDTDWR